jgi:hypothetical protein
MAGADRRTQCTVCRHSLVVQINWLIASGAPLKPLGPRFGLSSTAIYNHAAKHVSDQFKASVRVGPFATEEKLREICAENGESVLTQLRAINGAVAARWLNAFEAGAHDQFVDLTVQLRKNLELMAKLTKELVPPSTTVVNTNNFTLNAEYVQVIAALSTALRPFPEARQAVRLALCQFNTTDQQPPLIETSPEEAA